MVVLPWPRFHPCAELPSLDLHPEGFAFPAVLKASQVFWTVVEGALLAWLLNASARLWTHTAITIATVLGLGKLLYCALLMAPVAWLILSLVHCYDASLPQPVLAPDGTLLQKDACTSSHVTSHKGD